MNISPVERILNRIEIGWFGCWVWQGGRTSKGYGTVYAEGVQTSPHRVLYQALVAPIPDGLTIDHLCRNPRCCSLDHLQVVTPRENTLRGVAPPARQARQTHCKRGHPLTGTNVRVSRKGRHRYCMQCERWRGAFERARLRGETAWFGWSKVR